MDYKELNQALVDLDQLTYMLEEQYIENEGECTDQTDEMEEKIAGLKDLITSDGVDMLGAWLKSKEDRKKALKAEKDYITRQMAALDESIEFIKHRVCMVMDAAGIDKTDKGARGYGFTKAVSETTLVNKEVLKTLYKDKVDEALTAAHIPCYISVTLNALSTKYDMYGPLAEGDELIFTKVSAPTVKFTKPRESKK